MNNHAKKTKKYTFNHINQYGTEALSAFIFLATIIGTIMLLCFIIVPKCFHVFFSPPQAITTHKSIIIDILCYTIADICLYSGIIMTICYHINDDYKPRVLTTLIPSNKKIMAYAPYCILQVTSLLSGIPIIAHHLGYPIPRYIGITVYTIINAILAYIPNYIYNHVTTNEQFNDIFQQLSTHAQIETLRQIGIKKSTNIHIPYRQKQKFIQHHESSSIIHTP